MADETIQDANDPTSGDLTARDPDGVIASGLGTRRLYQSRLRPLYGAMSARVAAYLEEAARVARGIDCFDYVPSSPATLMAHLDALPRGRFCEWGSGIGNGIAVAATLGFEAVGIELDQRLVEASRRLLERHGFAVGKALHRDGAPVQDGSPVRGGVSAEVRQGDFLASTPAADVYFVYCWPGQANRVRERFLELAPPTACLLFGEGAERIVRYRIV